MSRIRGILLDKDGTLLDFEATWTKVARELALHAAGGDPEHAGFLLEQSGYDAASGRFAADSVFAAGTNADLAELWFPTLGREARADILRELDALSARGGAESAVAVAGVPEAVASLHAAGYRLGIATNDSTAGAERTLIALGIADLFSAAFGYDAVARPKPAPDMVLAFADMAGLRPAEIAMVGDSRHDMMSGRAAGAGLVIGVLSGTSGREALEPLADMVLSSAADLPDFLAGRE